MNVIVRDARPADREAILTMFGSHLRELGFTPNPAWDADMHALFETYQPPTGVFTVAESRDGILCGMGGLSKGEVRRLFVRPEFRGQGIGKLILTRLLSTALLYGVDRVRAVISVHNQPSRALFAACGFLSAGSRVTTPGAEHCEVFTVHVQSDKGPGRHPGSEGIRPAACGRGPDAID